MSFTHSPILDRLIGFPASYKRPAASGYQELPVVFVTHDIDEALFLGDRLIVMASHPGRIIDDIRLPFPRPRHRDLAVSEDFVSLKRRCIDLLRPAADRRSPRARLSPLGLPTSALEAHHAAQDLTH